MKIQSLAAILTFLTALISSSAWANCGDTICSVAMGGGKSSYIDYGACSFGTQPYITLTDAQGNDLINASGQITQLPNDPSQIQSPPRTNDTYILAGFWSDGTGSKIKFDDGGGAEVFNLQLKTTPNGKTGTLTSQVPGLIVTNAAVNCGN